MCQGSAPAPTPLPKETIASQRTYLRETLGESGYRITAARMAIYDVLLHVNDHICVEHILDHLSERHHTLNINKTTVYRTLDLLMELGLVTEMHHADGSAQYELTLHGPHGHFLCRECGRVQDIPLGELRAIQQRIESAFGFGVELMDQALPGICAECSATHLE